MADYNVPPVEEEPEIETEFDTSYQTEIKAIPPNVRVIMEKIAFRIKRDGISVDDACLLCNVDTEWLATQIELYPVIARALAKKDLEYRVTLTRPLNRKAASGDTKLAQYLLEMKTPKQKRGSPSDPDESDDMLARAIAHIQEHGDSSPLVRRESGAAVLVTSASSATRLMNKIKHVLDKK